jgi:glycosyltransferase involved in cell wall biosynthesis
MHAPTTAPRVLVVLPTFDEIDTLPQLIAGLNRHAPQADVLVVDDGSPDGTGRCAEALAARDPRIHVVQRSRKLGLGSALLDGFRWAQERGYDQVVQMDSDLSHDPATVPALLEALGDADLVLGSRYIAGGGVRGWAKRREALSRAANAYARAVLGLIERDLTTGFRALGRPVVEHLLNHPPRSEGYAFQIEVAHGASRAGFRLAEVPIIFSERSAGRSKLSRRIVIEAVFRVWSLRLARNAKNPKKSGGRSGPVAGPSIRP